MKMRNIYLSLIIMLSLCISSLSFAAGDNLPPKEKIWPFDGMLGKFDRVAAQRGFKVYKEVCSACHGLKNLYFRNLVDLGFSEAEVKTLASEYEVKDGPNDEGDFFGRPALLSDKFPTPFENENQARAANGGSYPLDLSLIVKARPNGANYLFSILTGYKDHPADFQLQEGLHYNPYFSGKQIAMAPPLSHDQVEYVDGPAASIEQMAKDLTIFLQWVAEPEMEHRKSMGLKALIYLVMMTVMLYVAKQRIWKKLRK